MGDDDSDEGNPERRGLCLFIGMMLILVGGAVAAGVLGIKNEKLNDDYLAFAYDPLTKAECDNIVSRGEDIRLDELPNATLAWTLYTIEFEAIFEAEIPNEAKVLQPTSDLCFPFNHCGLFPVSDGFQKNVAPQLAGCDISSSTRRDLLRETQVDERRKLEMAENNIRYAEFTAGVEFRRGCSVSTDALCYIVIANLALYTIEEVDPFDVEKQLKELFARDVTDLLDKSKTDLIVEMKLTRVSSDEFSLMPSAPPAEFAPGTAAPTIAPTNVLSPPPSTATNSTNNSTNIFDTNTTDTNSTDTNLTVAQTDVPPKG